MEIGLERKGRQEESVVALIYAVEDDKNILEIEMFALKNSGYQVDGFECARDFYKKRVEISLEMCAKKPPIPHRRHYWPKRNYLSGSTHLPSAFINSTSRSIDCSCGILTSTHFLPL